MIKNNCQEIESLLDAYHDGEVTGCEKELIEGHLSDCPDCQRKLEEVGLLVRSLKSLPRLSSCRDLSPVLEELAAGRPAARNRVVRPLTFGAVGIAAAVALLFVTLHLGGKPLAPPTVANLPGPPPPVREPGSQLPPGGLPQPAGEPSAGNRAGQPEEIAELTPPGQVGPTGSQPEMEGTSGLAAGKPVTGDGGQTTDFSPALPDDGITYVALSDNDPLYANEALGISTDEDGLYAIKL